MPVKKNERLVELDNRIQKALFRAYKSGGVDGSHHKMWVIDQMVRELTGCPLEKIRVYATNPEKSYDYEELGESEAYKEFVRNAKDGEDGLDTYEWDTGIAP